MINNRKEERFDREHMPKCLKTVVFSAGLFDSEHLGTPLDASDMGMRIVADGMTVNDIHENQTITIKTFDPVCKLKSKVAYVTKAGDHKIKFGIVFKNHAAIEKYNKLLHEMM